MLLHTKLNRCYTRIVRWCSQSVAESYIKKSVFISRSNDIYTNLALEDWIYRNTDLNNHHILMLWQNEPCVVIGRHQNPWLEANVSELPFITDRGVQLARRDSGGGTVFHDLGNLNLTFFTPKDRYNRRYNLEIITKAIFRKFGIQVDISPREDLTLRVNVNEADLRRALRRPEVDIKTNATKSIRSEIANLCDEDPNISVNSLMNAIGWEYMRTPALAVQDGGLEQANRQKEFKLVDPTDVWYPGIGDIRTRYSSWDWRYGKTPKFNISKSFAVPNDLASKLGTPGDLKVVVVIENGKINNISVAFPSGHAENVNNVADLQGQKFSEEALNRLESVLSNLVDDRDRFVTKCLKQIISSV
ncbi:hypothetical protein NQ318_008594 [Aromia moschata]|uniref:BPL/LPL catalytic domain-containing protein n=1 Tax=Aromia moschata TaxID=1265417 RepID=A0AAV8YXG9_9CUCU|nr:hypothetical protein NQ318_008594 [Aromia moschata]